MTWNHQVLFLAAMALTMVPIYLMSWRPISFSHSSWRQDTEKMIRWTTTVRMTLLKQCTTRKMWVGTKVCNFKIYTTIYEDSSCGNVEWKQDRCSKHYCKKLLKDPPSPYKVTEQYEGNWRSLTVCYADIQWEKNQDCDNIYKKTPAHPHVEEPSTSNKVAILKTTREVSKFL